MLYSDQVGLPVAFSKGRPGLAWVRTTTDIPAAMTAILRGDTGWKSYFRSMKNCNVEAVFSTGDPLPGVAEVALIPYLAFKRGF
jgi:predicted ATP-grasp superfamily ATP-dependent carboligase